MCERLPDLYQRELFLKKFSLQAFTGNEERVGHRTAHESQWEHSPGYKEHPCQCHHQLPADALGYSVICFNVYSCSIVKCVAAVAKTNAEEDCLRSPFRICSRHTPHNRSQIRHQKEHCAPGIFSVQTGQVTQVNQNHLQRKEVRQNSQTCSHVFFLLTYSTQKHSSGRESV